MPKVNRVVAAPTQTAINGFAGATNIPWNSADDIFSDMRPVQQRPESIMLSLYGVPKSGKSRLMGTFPKPLLILGTDDGTASLVGSRGIDFKPILKCDQVPMVCERLQQGLCSSWKRGNKGQWEQILVNGKPSYTGEHFVSVGLDHGTKYRDMRISEICGLESTVVQKTFRFASKEQWQECSASLKRLLRPLLDLGRNRNLNVIIIAQEANLNEWMQDGKSSKVDDELIHANMGPAIGRSVADWINSECDCIGQCCIKSEVVTETAEGAIQGAPPVELKRKTGRIEYCLRVQPNEVYRAGFRVSLGVKIEQDFIVDPTYEKIVKLILGEK